MWDSIAKQAYGTENAMDQLMRANPDLLQAAVFGAGEIVLLPQISAQEAASTAVPAKFSHSPVSPSGQRIPIRITGNKSAVDTEIMDAGRGFSTASI